MSTFDDIAQSLKAHPHKAQILLELRTDGESLEKALSTLESVGVGIPDYTVLQAVPTRVILFSLSSEDMREAVLKLIEAGFTQLKGINPKCWRIDSNKPFSGKEA